MDNVVISDMFLYLIMLNLLKENYVLHAHLPHRPSSLTNDHHVRVIFRTRIMRRLECKLFITSRLCYMSLMCQSVDHTSKK